MHKIYGVSLAVLALLACDYDAPLNPQYEATNTISGTLLADGVENPGSAIVFIFDAKNPPPPIGTGSPLTFSTVPASHFTTDGAGVKSAPYAIPYLPDTTTESGFEEGFLVTALLDSDGNFNPFASGTGGSTCGDWLGEHKDDVSSLLPAPVFVERGQRKSDITILINRQQPWQRPAFAMTRAKTTVSRQTAAESGLDQTTKTQRYRVKSVGVHTAYGDPPVAYDLDGPCMTDDQMSDTCGTSAACHCEADVLDPCETAFWLQFVDSDGDGQQDPYPAQLQADNGILDTWPRVFLEYIGAPTIDDEGNTTGFENEYGNNTFEWPVGTGRMLPERWVNENYPAAFSLMTLGISNIVPDTGNKFDPFPVKEMSVTFSPAFRHYHAGGAFDVDPPGPSGPWDLIDVRCFTTDGVYPDFATCTGDEIAFDVVPAGAWRLTMVTQVGQTWTLPNEIGVPGLAEDIGLGPMVSTSPDFDIGSQATYLLLE